MPHVQLVTGILLLSRKLLSNIIFCLRQVLSLNYYTHLYSIMFGVYKVLWRIQEPLPETLRQTPILAVCVA